MLILYITCTNRAHLSNFRITTGKKQVSARERLTIYFHAVLSKDFKLDPNEDRVFIRAGDHIGTWDTNAVELSVSR